MIHTFTYLRSLGGENERTTGRSNSVQFAIMCNIIQKPARWWIVSFPLPNSERKPAVRHHRKDGLLMASIEINQQWSKIFGASKLELYNFFEHERGSYLFLLHTLIVFILLTKCQSINLEITLERCEHLLIKKTTTWKTLIVK